MDELLIGLAAALSFLFGWNNSSLLIGNLRGSGSLSFTAATLTAVLGLLAGALLEGSKMVGSLTPSLTSQSSTSVLTATLLISVLLTLGLTLVDLPVSFSMITVGAFLGAAFAGSLSVNFSSSEEVIAFWFFAPVAAGLLTVPLYFSYSAILARLGIFAVDSINRVGSLVTGLAVAYTFGANNLGLFYGAGMTGEPLNLVYMLGLAAVASMGVLAFGRNALGGSIGDRMMALSPQGVLAAFVSSSILVWIGTQLALPVSISQCLLGGMLGAAYSRIVSAINGRLVKETLSLWVLAPLAAFGLAFAVEHIL